MQGGRASQGIRNTSNQSNIYGKKTQAINNDYYKSDNENEPLPSIPLRSSHINLEVMKVQPKVKHE